MKMEFQRDDGGRAAAGYKGQAGDCVVRSIAIATGKPYQEVYDAINALAQSERTGTRKRGKSSARAIHDTGDPQWWTIYTEGGVQRTAARCVYGFFEAPDAERI